MIGDIPVQSNAGELNGLALWCDWELVPGLTLSSGPVRNIVMKIIYGKRVIRLFFKSNIFNLNSFPVDLIIN